MPNLIRAVCSLIVCVLVVGPLVLWVERDYQLPNTLKQSNSSANKSFQVFEKSGLSFQGAAVVSEGKNIVLFFEESENQRPTKLYLWEEGVGVTKALAGLFRGNWGIQAAHSFDTIVLFPLSPDASYRPAGGDEPCAWGANLLLKLSKPRSEQLIVDAKPLSYTATCDRGISTAQTELSLNTTAKILTFQVESERVYWRSYSLNGIDSTARRISFGGGVRETWNFGHPKGVPVVGDYNGDGLLDLATFVPNHSPNDTADSRNWHVVYSGPESTGTDRYLPGFRKGDESVYWGHTNAIAVPGDYDGDGATDMGVYFPNQGVWQVLLSSGEFNQVKAMLMAEEAIISSSLGGQRSIPVPGDYNGDSCDDFATVEIEKDHYLWRVNYSSCHGKDALAAESFTLGVPGDIPLSADYDGDLRVEPAVYSPKRKRWFIKVGKETNIVKWAVPKGLPFVEDVDGDGLKELGFYLEDASSQYAFYLFNRRFSKEVSDVFEGRLPVVTKIRRARISHPPVQVVLYKHQRASIEPAFLGVLDASK